jgi:hypothetical protein
LVLVNLRRPGDRIQRGAGRRPIALRPQLSLRLPLSDLARLYQRIVPGYFADLLRYPRHVYLTLGKQKYLLFTM